MYSQVIGAGRGVGREIALQLSQLGVAVACIDINAETCEATTKRARHSGVASSYVCDVTNRDQVAEIVEKVRSELGEVTMLLHCCGVPSPRALIHDPPEIRRTMDVSVLSHFWVRNPSSILHKQNSRSN